MKKPCALLFLFLAVSTFTAVPIQPEARSLIEGFFTSILTIFTTITNGALNIFSSFVQNVSVLVTDALAGINALASSTIQAVSNTTIQAIAIFRQVLSVPANIAKNIQNALSISPNEAMKIISEDLNKLINATNITFQMALEVEEELAAQIAANITALIELKKAIIANVTAAVQFGTSGFINFLFPKPLIQTLGDVTLKAIESAIKTAASLMNILTTMFANAITNNPFIAFVRDGMIASTQQALNEALIKIIQLVNSTVIGITQQVNATVTAAINFTQQIVPQIQNSTIMMIGNLQIKITQLIQNATHLSDSYRAMQAIHAQYLIGNLTALGTQIAMNFTMAFKNLTDELKKDINQTVIAIHELASNLTKQIIIALNSTSNRTCTKAKCAIKALKGIKPIVQLSVTGLINCVVAAVNTIANQTESIVVGVNSTLSKLAANITFCISLSTEGAVNACFGANVTCSQCTFSQLVNMSEKVIQNLIPMGLVDVNFEKCKAAVATNATMGVGVLAQNFTQCLVK